MSELTREVVRDGRRIAVLRCYDGDDGTIVEADVTPTGAHDPVHRGPYRFASATDAFGFVQEALLALQYLGCTISSTPLASAPRST